MKNRKRGLAVLLAALLIVPNLPAKADVVQAQEKRAAETVQFNTGNRLWSVVEKPDFKTETIPGKEESGEDGIVSDKEEADTGTVSGNETVSGNGALPGGETQEDHAVDSGNGGESDNDNESGDACFEEDGSYTINIPEVNPFFPYEVQFVCDGEVSNHWFMTPEDSVEVGGHTFYVSAYFDNTALTQMSLTVAGKTVVVYPEEKVFTDDGGAAAYSLLPLKERSLKADLTGFTPVELTMVSMDRIFAGNDALKDTDKVVWTTSYGDDYTISSSGDQLDLSYNTYGGGTTWEMIVGEADQLAADNTRYFVRVTTTNTKEWLLPTIYTQDGTGQRQGHPVVRNDYQDYGSSTDNRGLSIGVSYDGILKYDDSVYIGLALNPAVFGSTNYQELKIFKGQFATAGEAEKGIDITGQIFSPDMTPKDAGYAIQLYAGQEDKWITMVTYDSAGQATGCLPVYLQIAMQKNSMSHRLFVRENNIKTYITSGGYSSTSTDGCTYTTRPLNKGYAANGRYYMTMTYIKGGSGGGEYDSEVTAAFVGQYSTIAEAVAANASNVTEELFGGSYQTDGYEADYSDGVYFTIFVGEDGTPGQEVHRHCIKTVEGTELPISQSMIEVYFQSPLYDSSGNAVPSYVIGNREDSYGEFNYQTILVGPDTDLTSLAPSFGTSSGVKLYTAGGSTPEVSGRSIHDFSNGPVQYTASPEDGTVSKNYWLQIIKAAEGPGQLYINSLADGSSETREENNIIYSTREIMLDGYHNYYHDILLANRGTEPITALSAELVSDVVELDDYWTLKGVHQLPAFEASEIYSYGNENLAKIRIKAKEGIAGGTGISGTLTLKSAGNTIMVLTLTGTVGDPVIVTTEVPQAVKYVPYGTMIQNSNKYSWNRTSYRLMRGMLPAGMEIRENGELYGVPAETGDFTFTVRMDNSYSSFADDTKTFILTVAENTDDNVEAANDEGYQLTQRIMPVYLDLAGGSSGTSGQTMVSQGEYNEFVDIYLDGVKLVENEDYTSEAGSTRITIRNQTLAQSGAPGMHTLGIEFRTQDTGILKRAAQNYVVNSGKNPNPDGENSGGNGGGSNEGGNGSGNSGGNEGGSNGSSGAGAVTGEGTVQTVTYTIKSGDTLWGIAKKLYGSGEYWQKIFRDNADVIKNPDKIRVGQVLTIYLNQGVVTSADTETGNTEGKTYVVETGDTLWKIAQKIYGAGRHWRKIYQMNQESLKDPGRIYAGQVLLLPES